MLYLDTLIWKIKNPRSNGEMAKTAKYQNPYEQLRVLVNPTKVSCNITKLTKPIRVKRTILITTYFLKNLILAVFQEDLFHQRHYIFHLDKPRL